MTRWLRRVFGSRSEGRRSRGCRAYLAGYSLDAVPGTVGHVDFAGARRDAVVYETDVDSKRSRRAWCFVILEHRHSRVLVIARNYTDRNPPCQAVVDGIPIVSRSFRSNDE
jgi:hypothetical protein